MINAYLGIDIGSISTKGVIIDDENNILAKEYLWTKGQPIVAVKELLVKLHRQIKDTNIKVMGVGTTGSGRRLIGAMLDASVVKNEITAHAVGTTSLYPNIKTILEIGGQDSKIILIDNGIVIDYAMNTLCAAGTGAFLASQAKRLGIRVEDFGDLALSAKNKVKIAARCTVFAESDLVHKTGMGYKKEDIIAGLCDSVVVNYLNNVGKGKKIKSPIIFQGGVSKNKGVKKAFEEILKEHIIIDENGHLMGALGVAILAKKSGIKKIFKFNIINLNFITETIECNKCPNNCEIISIKKDNQVIDAWGNRCDNGALIK
ncbi:MAG: 2-hydroxyglutaryl-CoA dehydratase [Tenericutes bacterium]|nr:2-hydroxyglutaryl-CoA dehydratase [Mycoplasmatota bacterium]